MGLLSPWFLAGIAALAVPFYVHLLRRHTTIPRPFSSLMFFERRTQSSIKHRRLRYLLLLSLRALLLLLLVFAFANPFINRSAAKIGRSWTPGNVLMVMASAPCARATRVDAAKPIPAEAAARTNNWRRDVTSRMTNSPGYVGG